MNKNNYLSDAELDALILEIEASEMVSAPAYLKEETVLKLSEKQNSVESKFSKERDKVLEFRNYCFRVIASAVAAIALMFVLPGYISDNYAGINARIDPAVQYEKYIKDNKNFGISENNDSFDIFDRIEKIINFK